jgi:hypothetical protein
MFVDLPTYTLIHVALSMVGVFAGLVVMGGFMAGVRFHHWVEVFLSATVLANLTGFGFPFVTIHPSHIVGVLSLLVLSVVFAALYWKHLAGSWGRVFVICSVLALYLNVFVLFARFFQKIPALSVLAPDPKASAFAVTQLLVVVLFVGLGRAVLNGFQKVGDA